ncbi:hypothetical protein LCGC14_1060960 [marine sediment metagenome]|uniref:Uncharacterized protein n=1 Tax=marine sediment metagenome TaxID=412755 RepID=A0A0F9ML77_9ZZZZ
MMQDKDRHKKGDDIDNILAFVQSKMRVLSPEQVSRYAADLAIHMATMSEEMANAGNEYYLKWEALRLVYADKTDGFVEKKSKATKQYYDKKRIEARFEAVKQVVQALKKRATILSEESRGNH